jgi:predicted esterase
VPMFIAQGDDDQLILPEFTERYVERLCASGNRVEYQIYPGATQLTVVEPSAPVIVDWFAARLAGEPAPTNCQSAS